MGKWSYSSLAPDGVEWSLQSYKKNNLNTRNAYKMLADKRHRKSSVCSKYTQCKIILEWVLKKDIMQKRVQW
jgi:hypothetical protein